MRPHAGSTGVPDRVPNQWLYGRCHKAWMGQEAMVLSFLGVNTGGYSTSVYISQYSNTCLHQCWFFSSAELFTHTCAVGKMAVDFLSFTQKNIFIMVGSIFDQRMCNWVAVCKRERGGKKSHHHYFWDTHLVLEMAASQKPSMYINVGNQTPFRSF